MDIMNILYISNDDRLMAGASHSMFNMIHALREDVHPIVLVADHGEVEKYCISHNIECLVVNFLQLYFPRQYKNPLLHGLSYLKHIRDYNRIEIECANRVYEKLKYRDISIVHSNSTILTVGIVIAKKLKAKHVWHVREFLNSDFNLEPFRGRKRLERQVLNADGVIAITHQIYDHWNLGKAKSAEVIWNAVRTRADICFEASKDKYFLFCSAHLTHQKGADYAIDRFEESGLAEKGFRLKMVGEYDEIFKNYVDSKNCSGAIELLGYQKDIKPFMLKASAFLMFSLNEAMGRTTIEAMFYGCPVIARKSGGTLDFLKDNENGYLFETKNECISLMEKISDNTPKNIIANAHKLVYDNFTEEAYKNKILSFYSRL